ncbi:MAG: acrylyl-CoA reductase family protein [Acidimicrobiales bacterium]
MDARSFILRQDKGSLKGSVEQLSLPGLADGEVEICVEWSGVNYKDALVATPGNRVAKRYPLVPGVDLAGRVLKSNSSTLKEGTDVIAHGYGIGVSRDGGFAEVTHLPAEWVVPLPSGMTTRHAMAIGTAGFTAVMCFQKLVHMGVNPSEAPVLVTGATGGVGSWAITVLARNGFEVIASTGKADEHPYLRRLGASQVISRDELLQSDSRTLGLQKWAGVIDCVGGQTLAAVLRTVRYGGAVAATGLTGGSDLSTNVYPFITRGISLLGVDTVATPIEERSRIWSEMSQSLPLSTVDETINAEIGLSEVPEALRMVEEGALRGRILVRPHH